MKRCSALALAAVLCVTSRTVAAQGGLPRAKPEDVGLSSAQLAKIAPAFAMQVATNRIAGAVFAVSRHGKLVYWEAIGNMDAEKQTPMERDAVFRLYSMTKPVTTVAILQLMERGQLKLDDPVSKYIPAFANTQLYVSGGAQHPVTRALEAPITIQELLTHTAGLTYGAFGETAVDSIYRAANILGTNATIEFLADSLARLPLLYAPATKWNYSLAMDVAGRIVEVASGKTLDKYFQDEIFEPLLMHNSAFHATPSMQGHITTLYARAGTKLVATTPLLSQGYRDDGKPFMGGQGLLGTIPDYLRFTQMLLNGGELDGKRVLKKETVALMLRNHLPAGVFFGSANTGFAYGGSITLDTISGTPGPAGIFRWSGYASTFFWIDPKNDLTAMVWTQLVPTASGLDGLMQRMVYNSITGK